MAGVRPKKALGQHFLTDMGAASSIAAALTAAGDVLEVGPGTGVLTQFLLKREDLSLKVVEIDHESVEYLLEHYPALAPNLLEADFLKLSLEKIFPGPFSVIGNFPYNISSQIFFKILDYRDSVPEVAPQRPYLPRVRRGSLQEDCEGYLQPAPQDYQELPSQRTAGV